MASFASERTAVERLVTLIGFAPDSYADPNPPGVETGADVLLTSAGKRIGVQVTVYHADEGQNSDDENPKPQRKKKGSEGSFLRADEEKKAREAMKEEGVKAYGHGASAQYLPPLSLRVGDKVAKAAARPTNFDENWLLVCAEVNGWGATASTMIHPAVVSVDDLNARIGPILSGSPFSKAFLLIMLSGVVYQWTAAEGWQIARDIPAERRKDEERIAKVVFNQDGERDKWLRDPEGMEAQAIAKVLEEFKMKHEGESS